MSIEFSSSVSRYSANWGLVNSPVGLILFKLQLHVYLKNGVMEGSVSAELGVLKESEYVSYLYSNAYQRHVEIEVLRVEPVQMTTPIVLAGHMKAISTPNPLYGYSYGNQRQPSRKFTTVEQTGYRAGVFYKIKVTTEDGVIESPEFVGTIDPQWTMGTVTKYDGKQITIKMHPSLGGAEFNLNVHELIESSYYSNVPRDILKQIPCVDPVVKAVLQLGDRTLIQKDPDTGGQVLGGKLSPKKASDLDLKGLSKYKALVEEISGLHPLARVLLSALLTSKSVQKIPGNRLMAAFFDEMGLDAKKALDTLVDTVVSKNLCDDNKVRRALPGADKVIEEIEGKADWSKRKDLADKAEGLIDKNAFPKLFEAVVSGKIPLAVFNQPTSGGVLGAPVNREFDLIEAALGREDWAEVVCDVASSAASRTTYERDFTSWLMFMEYSLPEYLNKHAPRAGGWRCLPKFVESSWELEMSDTDENGTTKRRSAMTPVADNEAGTVTVPYVAVRVAGVRTQWCYSRHYHLFQRGFYDSISNGVVTKDLEVALNGRDDYGLMFFTLNGTATATGYPTFLIIFERRQSGPFVHFHRVRPCRSKDGVLTPANQLIEATYQYMAGNVPASEIVTQQGDIMIMRAEGDPVRQGAKVAFDKVQQGASITFESHKFVGPLSFWPSTAKTPNNRLGFIYAEEGLNLEHPEHDHTDRLPGGWYEVRRAKSYENNPVGIWSLTID